MSDTDPPRFIHDDPTADEVATELRKRRESVERAEEMRRRQEWDAAHPEVRDDPGHGLGEIEAVSEDDMEIEE